MRIRLDGDTTLPVYRRIADSVMHQVATGAMVEGERLPTIRQLAAELQVDRNTVVRAYRTLDREGVVSTERGRGTFVSIHPHHPHLTRHRQQRLQLLVGEGVEGALSLGYTPGEIRHVFAELMLEWERARNRLVRRRTATVRSRLKRKHASSVDGEGK